MELNKDVFEKVIIGVHNDLKIDIVFENCEYISIPFTSIVNMEYKVGKDIKYDSENNFKSLDMIKLEIINENLKGSCLFDNYTPYERLQGHNDITQICIVNKNTETTYFVPYEEENENIIGLPNKNQITYINCNGNLVIDIFSSNVFESENNE